MYSRKRVYVRGMYDDVDWTNFKNSLIGRGYAKKDIRPGGMPDGVAWVDLEGGNGVFRFEYDDWGSLDFYPDDPDNEALVDELNGLADEIEEIGSSNENYRAWSVGGKPRRRT